MRICITGMTALVVLRELRKHGWVPPGYRVGPYDPEAYPRKHWSKRALLGFLEKVLGFDVCSHLPVLQTCAVSSSARLRCRGVSCSVMTNDQAARGFIDVGGGLRIASPELLFLQMGEVMDAPVLMMLGSELTGRYSRASVDPVHGGATYKLKPLVAKESIKALMRFRGYVRNRETVAFALERMAEYSWSPMESVLGTMLNLPRSSGGYDMGPVTLNRDVAVRGSLGAGKRIPDILIGESGVGINYEGVGHFGILELGKAMEDVVRSPGPDSLAGLRVAVGNVRRHIVEDKRRDRDLLVSGLRVVTMTSEDLSSVSQLDREVYEVYRMAMRRLGKAALPLRDFIGSSEERRQRQGLLVALTRPKAMAI